MFLNKLIILQILNIFTTKAIINKNSATTENSKTLQTGTFYLNSQRPLWILQDVKDEKVYAKKPIKEKAKYDYISPLTYHNKQHRKQLFEDSRISERIHKNFKPKAQKRSRYNKNSKGVQLPHNYIPVKKASRPNLVTSSRRYNNSKFIQNMPVFDAIPGDESYTKSTPIFIYTGNKGRMLLNTMLNRNKYPMQEPVPGQALYPPQALVFKPKALVENLQQNLNITMIPFYSYEAIDPRSQPEEKQLVTTASSASSSPSLLSSFSPLKKQKIAKQYSAFYSPQEVLSQPIRDQYHYHYRIEQTTNFPLTLEKPYANHRFNNVPPSTTTPLPHKIFEVNYNDGEDKFQITYEDDTAYLERPLNVQTTTLASFPYESYTFDKNYYAFPVYTMAKLLVKDDSAQRLEESKTAGEHVTVERQQIDEYIDKALKEENDNLLNKPTEDTWFILNSRYKGPSKINANILHSSKYIQTSPAKVQNHMDLMIPKPTEKETPLLPHMRSLYDENMKINL